MSSFKSFAYFLQSALLLIFLAAPVRADAPATQPGLPTIVFAIAEDEYHAKETLPAFAKDELASKFTCIFLQSDSKTDLPGLQALKDADLLVMFMRRRTLPETQLNAFKSYFDSGKPVIGLRTACHAFQNWLEFDSVVFGSHYHNHYPAGKSLLSIKVAPAAAANPILRGVAESWQTPSSLYKMNPLADRCTVLLTGTWQDQPPEPLAWTTGYHGGKVFFTALGSMDDFKDVNFKTMLKNAIDWSLKK